MEIVIESDPLYRPTSTSPAQTTSYLRSPVAPVQPIVSTSSAFYYATLPRGGQRRTETLDGAATTSVRRVDKSGLLEIAELEPARQNSSRHIAGADCHATLSRRIERSGLLESVPEIPDQCHRTGLASEELLAAAATTRSMVERQQHLLGAETDIVESALLRRRSALLQELSQDSATSSEACSHTRSSPRVKFAADENLLQSGASLDEMKEPRKSGNSVVLADCLGRLSPRQRDSASHTTMTLSNIPDVIEAHGTSATSNAATATTTTTTTTSTTTGGDAPEGERAEAEGCEHTNIDSLEEARVSYKGTNSTGSATTATGNKIAHNDNIQAVHVIILSEQL